MPNSPGILLYAGSSHAFLGSYLASSDWIWFISYFERRSMHDLGGGSHPATICHKIRACMVTEPFQTIRPTFEFHWITLYSPFLYTVLDSQPFRT